MKIRALLSLALGVVVAACGGSTNTTPTPEAGPTPETGVADHFVADTGHDAGTVVDSGADVSDAPVGTDGPPTPVGTTIEQTANAVINGVTDDGYVVYGTNDGIKVAPVAGGASTLLVGAGDAGLSYGAIVVHNVAFIWSEIGALSNAGTLSVWTHTMGTPKAIATASAFGTATASADSASILYSDGASSDGSTTSMYGAAIATLGAPVMLESGVQLGVGATCSVQTAFSGTGAATTAVIGACLTPSAADAGAVDASADATPDATTPDAALDAASDAPAATPAATVVAYRASTWAPVPLASDALFFGVDTTATAAAVVNTSGALNVAPLSGAAPVAIEPAGVLSTTVPSMVMSPTSAFVAYTTAAGALKSSMTTTATGAALVPSGVNGIDYTSTNGNWAFVHNQLETTTGNNLPADLSLASLTAAGTPRLLTPASTVTGVWGDGFTTDTTYGIFMTSISVDPLFDYIGILSAVAVGKSTPPIQLASAAVNAGSGTPSDLALAGAKLSFTDNFNSSNNNGGSVDLRVIDLATATTSSLVVAGVDPFYAVSFDKKYILYTITYGASTDGIYSVAAP